MILKEEVLTTKGRPDIPDVPILQQKKHCLRSTVSEALFQKNCFRSTVSEDLVLKEEVLTTKGRPDIPDFPDVPDFPN